MTNHDKDSYEQLISDFPLLFDKVKYIDCGPGWYDLIYNLCVDLDEIISSEDWEINLYPCVTQVKEKYGTLCFYISIGSDEMYERINKAEADSSKICERCGRPGTLKKINGWYSTQCEMCRP